MLNLKKLNLSLLQIINFKVNKPIYENELEFIERIEDNLDMFVHELGSDMSITVTYDTKEEVANIKTLRMYEHAN